MYTSIWRSRKYNMVVALPRTTQFCTANILFFDVKGARSYLRQILFALCLTHMLTCPSPSLCGRSGSSVDCAIACACVKSTYLFRGLVYSSFLTIFSLCWSRKQTPASSSDQTKVFTTVMLLLALPQTEQIIGVKC